MRQSVEKLLRHMLRQADAPQYSGEDCEDFQEDREDELLALRSILGDGHVHVQVLRCLRRPDTL